MSTGPFTTQRITSPHNPLLRRVRRASQRGSLTEDGCCVAESFHLLQEALRGGCEIDAVLVSEGAFAHLAEQATGPLPAPLYILPDPLLRNVSSTENTQGVIALVRPPGFQWEQLFHGCPLLVVLDGVQDPGNVGAIARSAEAFGATGAILLKGSAFPFNPKALRASAGSLFRLPLLYGCSAGNLCRKLLDHGLNVYLTLPAAEGGPGGALPPDQLNLSAPCAFVIGSEAHGVGEGWEDAASVSIPTIGVESLNAAMAATVLLYEANRQRRATAKAGKGPG